jgi:selenide,water dikinase
MAEPKEPTRRLVLVGAGHPHLFVLERLAAGRLPPADVILLSPYPSHLYSGMLAGLVAGTYGRDETHLDLASLANKAGARFVLGSAVRLDPVKRQISVTDGRMFPYDIASFAIGSETSRPQAATGETTLSVKPIDQAGLIAQALDALALRDPTVIVAGGGPGGVEIALSIQARLRTAGRTGARVVLVERGLRLVANRAAACARKAAKALARNLVSVVLGREIEEVSISTIRLSDGNELTYDLLVWATGPAAPGIFRESGLRTDQAGFLLVDRTLRSVSDPGIFAAGDAATLLHAPATPKSGVYAVRQGPVLAQNLGLALTGAGPERFQHYQPQPRSLVLINTGDGRAILSYASVAVTGRWVMHLKDRIDRRFMRRFQPLATSRFPQAV